MSTFDFPWQRMAAGANLLSPDGELGITIFEEITTLAVKHEAINLGQGFPDADGPRIFKDMAAKGVSGDLNQYAPGSGILPLRKAIANHQKRFYGLDVDPGTEIVVTTGATEAIAAAVLAFIGPGDEVITFEPFYDSYGATIGLAGGIHKTVPLNAPDFQPDITELRAAFTGRTRMIVLNNPHNPTGTIFGKELLAEIVALAAEHDCLIVSDEVYEHLTFGVPHIPVATLPGAWDRTLTISSVGKTFSFTGWKVGWATGPSHLVASVRTVKQFLTYSSGTAFQPAVAEALDSETAFFTNFAEDLGKRSEVLAKGLEAAGMTVYRPQGTYFIVADVAPLGFDNALDLARRMPESIGVAGIPLSVFCHAEGAERTRSLMRFAFCKKPELLSEAAIRLSRLSAKVGG
ncbi:aminotransferase class I/II-fold pyridoxal phosphate-dependent enzyme [Paeniglutamicibacter sp. ABSL32-1]|uniref:aminotransferase class I/II-fold pyridoxal phosphate-dependent enzyme n=1 Tax=Paeniglutamicibacter quisquiliarum TaxID=2849498 RepID=UPI001C2CF4DA|nr:aminotransferase class I/II-fold pyridoxal phosphate-dependent enzyme [Paeniglutamicibacter quisquiliarum]MBV1780767.1 aminotransferase class I/II-fold pyridoxal phosphate-dependent enzyme [Paeniglutamicibacter quisquiliarum]